MAKKNLIPSETFVPGTADLEEALLSLIDGRRRLVKETEKLARKIRPSLLKDCLEVLSDSRRKLAIFEELLSRLYEARETAKKGAELAAQWAAAEPRTGAIRASAQTLLAKEETVAFLKLYKEATK